MNVKVARRSRRWGLRFRLNKETAERFGLPIHVRMRVDLPSDATSAEVSREEMRIAALLELLCRGQTEINGSLASYLGLPKPNTPVKPRQGDWPSLVQDYIDEFKTRTLCRENNMKPMLYRLDPIAGAFPRRAPDEITPKQWSEWLSSLEISADSKNRLRSLIGRVYRWGMTHQACSSDPTQSVAKFRRPRSAVRNTYATLRMIEDELARREYTPAEEMEMRRWRVLDEREQKELVALTKDKDPTMLPVVALALSGVSGIDIRCARKGAYDVRTGVFTGRRAKRGTAAFAVPIAPLLKPYLDRHVMALPEKSPFLPWLEGCTDHKQKMWKRWVRLVKETEFENLRLHALRHSYISMMIARGVSIAQLSQFCGHLDSRTTVDRYGHFLPDDAVELVASLRLYESA